MSIILFITNFRINKILFSFTLSTFFRNHIIEDKASVHAKFHVTITLLNDLYSSMTVKINLDSELIRYCRVKYRKVGTTLDILIMIFLILSSITYIRSIIRTYVLTKVWYIRMLCKYLRTLLM